MGAAERRKGHDTERMVVRCKRDGIDVSLTPGPGQSDADAAAEVEASVKRGERMRAQGVQSYRQWYRWVGPVKVLVAKEVGPPPWRLPRVMVNTSRRPYIGVKVGWRSTAYDLHLMWDARNWRWGQP